MLTIALLRRFGFRWDGTVWHAGKGYEYTHPLHNAKCIGMLIDMTTGTLSLYVDGVSQGPAFGVDSVVFEDFAVQRAQACVVPQRRVVVVFRRPLDSMPFVSIG